MYITCAIESPNSVVRKAIKQQKWFPTDDSARKVGYLAIMDASKKAESADPELESGTGPVYDRILKSADWLYLT